MSEETKKKRIKIVIDVTAEFTKETFAELQSGFKELKADVADNPELLQVHEMTLTAWEDQ
jgi:hypothetical protein